MTATFRRILAGPGGLVLLASVVSAQLTVTVTVNGSTQTDSLPYLIQPSGVQDLGGRFGESVPLICTKTCYAQEQVYGGCFLDYKVPFYNGSTIDAEGSPGDDIIGYFDYSTEICTEALCDTVAFQVFAQCMNCIVANGGETTRSVPDIAATQYLIDRGAATDERIDADRARAWLGNVTDFCAAQGKELEGVQSLTATPTTTGPYTTTWERSDTVDIPQWTEYTGLTPFISSIEADIVSGYLFGLTATGGQVYPTSTPTMTSGQQSSSATSDAAASPSVSNGAAIARWAVGRGFSGMFGVLVAAVVGFM